jgi:hypothetical protein
MPGNIVATPAKVESGPDRLLKPEDRPNPPPRAATGFQGFEVAAVSIMMADWAAAVLHRGATPTESGGARNARFYWAFRLR